MIDWQIMEKVAEDKKRFPLDYKDEYQHQYYLNKTKPKRKERKHDIRPDHSGNGKAIR